MCSNQGSPSPTQTLRGVANFRCDLPKATTIRIFENFVRMLPTPLFTTLWPHWAILGNQCDHLKMPKGLARSYFESRVRSHGVQNDLDDTKMTLECFHKVHQMTPKTSQMTSNVTPITPKSALRPCTRQPENERQSNMLQFCRFNLCIRFTPRTK